MDRSTKVMMWLLTSTCVLIVISMMMNQTKQAFAADYVGSMSPRGDGPTIVWFGVSQGANGANHAEVLYHRLWSDGRLQMRYAIRANNSCDGVSVSCDWVDIDPPPGDDGVACGADLNHDSVVDVYDVQLLLDWWGDSVVCAPTHECIDLGNLSAGVGG